MKMRIQINSRFLGSLLVSLMILVACRNGDETPTPGLPNQGLAVVNSLQVVTLETFPVQVQAVVGGNLSNSCTSVTGVNVQQQGVTFVLDVQTAFNDTGACAQVLVPFSQTAALNVLGLAAGTYTVLAGGMSQTFILAVDNNPAAAPEAVTSLTTAVSSAVPGQAVALTGQGFPPNAAIEIGIGLANATIVPISSIQSGADGRFTTQAAVPANAAPGEQWVFGATVNNATVLSTPILIQQPGQPDTGDGVGVPENGVNAPVNGLFQRTYIYLIALEDGGQVGCGDSVVPVVIDIEPTVAPMTAAYTRLLSIKDQFYGESGLYNTLYQSNLTLAGINIVNREAIVSLTGTLTLAGECDDPRYKAQLVQVALQYSTVDRVTIWLNGQVLTSSNEPVGPAGRG
jgi:hypothetical protein